MLFAFGLNASLFCIHASVCVAYLPSASATLVPTCVQLEDQDQLLGAKQKGAEEEEQQEGDQGPQEQQKQEQGAWGRRLHSLHSAGVACPISCCVACHSTPLLCLTLGLNACCSLTNTTVLASTSRLCRRGDGR